MIKKYRKKPVIIEAVQFTGKNYNEIIKFAGTDIKIVGREKTPIIKTLEGNMKVSKGDYIIKGIQGEFYPCKPDIFHDTYDEIE